MLFLYNAFFTKICLQYPSKHIKKSQVSLFYGIMSVFNLVSLKVMCYCKLLPHYITKMTSIDGNQIYVVSLQPPTNVRLLTCPRNCSRVTSSYTDVRQSSYDIRSSRSLSICVMINVTKLVSNSSVLISLQNFRLLRRAISRTSSRRM